MWSYIRKDGEPADPARRGACPPRALMGPQVEGGVVSSLEPSCDPPRRTARWVVTAARTDEVTALGRNQGSGGCVSACGGDGGGEVKGGSAPPPRHVQIGRVKDRFSWRHSQPDRQTRPQHRYTDTHRPRKQLPSVSLGPQYGSQTHTHQTAREQCWRPREAGTLHSRASAHLRGLSEDDARLCM